MRYLFIILLIFIFSCKKDPAILNNNSGNFVSFSVDTLLFDTIFTTIGSTTRYLKVYNNYNDDITINSIGLAKGVNSAFQLNIDGEPNHTIENTFLRNGDSLYIFAEVTIDPNGMDTAYIEQDAIVFDFNNNIQYVDLVAWGRDAYYHSSIPDFQQGESSNLDSMLYSDFFTSIPDELINEEFYYYSIKQNTTWSSNKPHVIYGDVIVENGATLEIEEGAEIYLHNNAWLVIDELSSLQAIGSKEEKIIFQSDRVDSHSIIDYANTPGQWGKIWILPGSINNKLEWTKIKNGKTGIHVDGLNDISLLPNTPILEIKNSEIFNMSEIGILGQGTKISAENLLIYNCGIHLLALNIGGDYNFKHCTFANFWPYTSRQTPSVFLNNYYEDIDGNIINRDLVKASFGNCIINGSNENEIFFDQSQDALFDYSINHSLLKLTPDYWQDWSNDFFEGNILTESINFVDYELFDFELDSSSLGIDAASEIIAKEVPLDLNGYSRTLNPDMGCYEKQ